MPPYFPDCFGDFNCDEDTAHDCWCGGSCRLLNRVGVKISRKNLDKIAENGNSVKEEERMNQLFCETTEELFCEITENLELTQKNKELFRIFLHSLDTEEMRIFILNRLFVRRIAENGEVRE